MKKKVKKKMKNRNAVKFNKKISLLQKRVGIVGIEDKNKQQINDIHSSIDIYNRYIYKRSPKFRKKHIKTPNDYGRGVLHILHAA